MSSAVSGATPSRAELLEYLSASRIAGPVATSRENNLANFKLMAQRDPGYLFGLQPRGAWTFDDILALMASRCGVSPDPLHDSGADSIDPALTVERIEAMAVHLHKAASSRARVLVATGHPTGVFVIHAEIARFLRAAGATLLAPPAWWNEGGTDAYGGGRPRERHLRCVLDVSVASQGANLLHTHSPIPMEL
ncbi:MAG TPA: phosphatase, partial [Acidothermaceae bacterium]|nr:phosphatase [Acidothermaceae bacterium]